MDSRAKFEQAVKDKWSDSFLFGRDTDGDYADEAVNYMWLGWQASRQALSSCSEIPNSSDPDSRQGLEGESVEYQFYHDAKWHNFIDDAHRYNTEKAGYPVRARYTHPASESKGRIEGDKSGYGRIADSSGDKQAVSVPDGLLNHIVSMIDLHEKRGVVLAVHMQELAEHIGYEPKQEGE